MLQIIIHGQHDHFVAVVTANMLIALCCLLGYTMDAL